jgi:hypothetical protein
MNTTLLFAELLIIGLQASVWIFVLTLVIFGVNWLQALATVGLADWQTVIVVIALSIIYVIGIIIDRLADLAFTAWDKKMRNRFFPNAPFPIGVMRFQLGKDNEYLNRQFEYTRSRMRISRASIINFALTTIFGAWLVFQLPFSNSAEKTKFMAVVMGSGILLTVSALYSWHRLTQTYITLVKSNWDLFLSQKESANQDGTNKGKQKRSALTKTKAG